MDDDDDAQIPPATYGWAVRGTWGSYGSHVMALTPRSAVAVWREWARAGATDVEIWALTHYGDVEMDGDVLAQRYA